MNNLFRRAMLDFEEIVKAFESLEKSMDIEQTDNLTLHNFIVKVEAKQRRFMGYEEQAKSLGYSSLGVALKALSQMKIEEESDISKLPEVFHKPPYIWVKGREPNRKKKLEGLVPMGVKEAERKHKMILPLLAEAWKLAATEESWGVQKDIIEAYNNSSAKEFEADLYTYINYLEPLTLEEELEEIKNPVELSPDLEALVTVLRREAQSTGEQPDERLLIARAVAQQNRMKRSKK